jgi:PadR family transcriptional regulator PadR
LVEEPLPRDASDLLHGTLDVLILKTLSWGTMHGYAIAEWIGQRAEGELVIVDAALYKALHRLEDAGAISSEWGLSDNNRRARFYSLTASGRTQLRAEAATWKRYAQAVGRILETG